MQALTNTWIFFSVKVFEVPGSTAFNTCCFTSDVNVLAGTQDGCLYKYDIRNTK